MLPDFPHFYKLKIEDKELYENSTAGYPPFSDILFATLHIWWNLGEQLAVASLNGNVVIRYHLPFDAKSSGYCLVGEEKIDESILAIFDYLKERGEPRKLVHVPEFVVNAINNKDNFKLKEEPDYQEYILDSKGLAELPGHPYGHIRTQVNRFLREVEGRKVEIKSLDLSVLDNQDHLFNAILEWEKSHPSRNDPQRTEHDALKKTLSHAAALDIENLSLYVDDKLQGVILYHQPHTKDHFVIHHLRFDYSIPYTSDFMTRHLAREAMRRNVPYINMEMDLGSENLRRHKMKLNPVHFFRKYTIKPEH
ncbi:MAG TPA: phosphatidylglycerol lysyltransferase domain-containing protein [Candidatus Saccharimonadales bacterium]|nr:phosphatidylglycerol lysyltransferase domain-containing protein [Candidatus Saccharimonadales bacterium]